MEETYTIRVDQVGDHYEAVVLELGEASKVVGATQKEALDNAHRAIAQAKMDAHFAAKKKKPDAA